MGVTGLWRDSGALSRLRRRDVARGAAAAATFVTGGAVLSACSGATASNKSSAAPTVQQNVIQLLAQVNNQGVPWNKTTIGLDQQFIDENFNAKNTGLRATVYPGGWGNPSAQIAASIAGSGYPDIFHSCCGDLSAYQAGGWLTDLGPLLRKDNIDPSAWSKPHVDVLTFDGKILALPSYDGPGVIAYRQDILDELGLAYPDPTWTYKEAADIWQQCATSKYGTGTAQKSRVGVSFFDPTYEWLNFWAHAWGGAEMDATRLTCLAGSPQAVGALGWVADLHKNLVATGRQEVGYLTGPGQAVFSMCGGWDVFPLASQLGSKVKWDILPQPAFPGGKATFGNIDFYGLNTATKQPDAAWSLLKFFTYEPEWQQFQMKATLVEPCLLQLWDNWETIVKQTAPPLQNKQLHWYTDAARGGYAYPTLFFEHAASQASTLVDNWLGQIISAKVTAQEGMTQLANQVNALEVAAAAETSQAGAVAKAFPSNGPAIAAVQPGL